MKLEKVHPVEMAVKAIDDTIKDLKQRKAELLALLPARKPLEPLTHLTDPRTGKRHLIKYNQR